MHVKHELINCWELITTARKCNTPNRTARTHTHTLRQFWQTLMRVIRRRMIGCGLDVRSKWSLCSRQIQCSQCLSLLLSCLNKSHMTNAFVQNCPEVQKNHMLHKHIDSLTCERACTYHMIPISLKNVYVRLVPTAKQWITF